MVIQSPSTFLRVRYMYVHDVGWTDLVVCEVGCTDLVVCDVGCHSCYVRIMRTLLVARKGVVTHPYTSD